MDFKNKSEQLNENFCDFDSDDSVMDPDFVGFETVDSNESSVDDECENNLTQEAAIIQQVPDENRKNLRNMGKCYKTKAGKTVSDRKVRNLEICKYKCKDKISKEQQQSIFNSYWKLSSNKLRQSFVSGLIDIQDTKSERKDKSATNPRARLHSYKYSLVINGENILVCQKCFLYTLCETQAFIKTIIKKKLGSGFFQVNRSTNNLRKISSEKESEVINFIKSFPSYESHYTRRDTSQRFLASDLSVTELYRQYIIKHNNTISFTKFNDIFKNLNLKFKKPKLDTCHKCDLLVAKILVADAEDCKLLQAQQSDHHNEADFAFKSKQLDKERALNDDSIKVLCFDLQQCLPTPFLRSSQSFYKRPLWTFNLTVHDCRTNQPVCFMWHEALAKRGGNEIASCLFQHLQSLPIGVKHVILYSDCCPGQNKNSFVATMFEIFMQLENGVEIIDHKFLVPGHTHMECDGDHALIEKKKKCTTLQIHHPRDWYQFIRTVGVTKTMIVKEMKQSEFFDFASASKERFTWRKVDEAGQKYNWNKIKWLRFTKEHGTVFFKNSLKEDEPFKSINLKRRGCNNVKITDLRQCYFQPVVINSKKKKDLMDMLPLIDVNYHSFYIGLKTEEMLDFHPDLTEGYEEGEEF